MDTKFPTVIRITIEYDDSSSDTIELIQRVGTTIYGLTRKRPDSETPCGAFTNGAIAALLFATAFTTKWSLYTWNDMKLMALIRCWRENSEEMH